MCPGRAGDTARRLPASAAVASPFHDLRELHPGQELVVLADLPHRALELPPVLVDQPLPLLLLLGAALLPSKLQPKSRASELGSHLHPDPLGAGVPYPHADPGPPWQALRRQLHSHFD